MTTFIYSLIDPITNEVRYIGKSNNPIIRLKKHIGESKNNTTTHKKAWINSLLKINKYPILVIEDEVVYEEWKFWEIYYIALYKSWGFSLVNSTDGGDTCNEKWRTINPMHINTSKIKVIESRLGKKLTKEHCTNLSISHKKNGIIPPSRKGSKAYNAIQVVINKINYNSYLEASIKLNIPLTSLKRKIKNKELC